LRLKHKKKLLREEKEKQKNAFDRLFFNNFAFRPKNRPEGKELK